MHELAEVWTTRKGLTWIGVTALFYVLVLIPFNYLNAELFGISLRPAAFLPATLGILFGPAAAWGLAIGNVAGDFFGGSWSPMSIFGFLVNLLNPYLAYLLFHWLMRGRAIRQDYNTMGCFLLSAFVTAVVTMVILAACGTIFFARPFESKVISYLGNNLFWALTAGPLFFWLVAVHAQAGDLVYGREWEKRKPATR